MQFKILYCGICHSDLHMVKNEWGATRYPVVPGYDSITPHHPVFVLGETVLVLLYLGMTIRFQCVFCERISCKIWEYVKCLIIFSALRVYPRNLLILFLQYTCYEL